ncbi:MAG: elongation factor G [Chloroflexi bacterium]|nr:elongation factor G [Chloroflexota bacterium]
MKVYETRQLRNVALVSHGGAGKTSLAEALLHATGATSRLGRVDEGNTVSDYDPEEIRRKISISLSLIPCEWQGVKINLLDAPGYADFAGEMVAALRVADATLVVVCAASGLEVGTDLAWRRADAANLPRFVCINKMDREHADFFKVVGALQARYGRRCVPLHLPIGSQASFEGVVDLVEMKALMGGKAGDIPAVLAPEAAKRREALMEAAAEASDELTEKYLEAGTLSPEELRRGLREGVASGKVVPILAGSALKNIGGALALEALREFAPSPEARGGVPARKAGAQSEVSLKPAAGGPLAALVFKTTADPYVGKITYFRVYSGTMRSDSQAWNCNKGRAERVGSLFVVRGKEQMSIPQLAAGDIGGVAKLAETSTGDTLGERENAVLLPGFQFPNPVYSASVQPKTKADLDKLSASLARLTEEDPTLRVRRDAETAETILSGLGETHVEVACERMRRKFGLEVLLDVPRVPYRETITIPIKSEYKHKKQTGGHGQYGHVFLELEPKERGSGNEFVSKVVGGSVPRNYIPAVEKGVIEALQDGILAHYPTVDIRVALYDGSYHAVDSSDMAFRLAGSQAVKKGLSLGQPVLLEPIMNLQVTVPDTFVGDVIGDLNSKRARVLGMTPQDGTTVVEAQAPLAELLRYATALRSITQGQGLYTMEFSRYEEVPAHLVQRLAEAVGKGA